MLDIKSTISNAIEYCSRSSKRCETPAETAENLKTQDCMLHSRFRYSIAKDIAQYIVSCYGCIIKDIKLYGSTMEYNAGKYSDIDLVLRVETAGDEIRNNLKALDNQLSQEYYLLIGEEIGPYVYLMDIHIIDESLASHDSAKAYLKYILDNESIPLAV